MSDPRLQAMARAYVEQGLSYAQIGEEYGLTRQRVGQLLGPLGLARNRVAIDRARRLQALQAAHARIMSGKMTLAEAAKELGYASGKSLRATLDRYGMNVAFEREDPPHGTTARYGWRKDPCRCDDCRRANAEHNQELRGREPPQHGASGYKNYGCRCKVCTEAYNKAQRKSRAAKRRRKEVVV